LYGSSRIGELRPDESDQNTYRKAISRDGRLYQKEIEPVKEELKEAEAVEEKTMGLSIFNEWDYKKDTEDLQAPELVDDPKKSQIVIGLTEADIIKIKEQLYTKEVQLDEVRRQQLEQDLARGYTLAQAQAAPKPTLEQYFGPSYHMKWRYRGNRHYELDNHLGNVQVVITDKKIAHGSDNWEYYTADILSVHDYYAFGQDVEERSFERGTYRYGFNGKEKQDDISSDDHNFGARIYDGRLGRWWSVDPLFAKYTSMSPYCFGGNNPELNIDYDGKDWGVSVTRDKKGTLHIDFTFSAAVLNSSGKVTAAQTQQFANNMRKQMEEVFYKRYKADDGSAIQVSMTADIRVIDKRSDLNSKEHLVEISDTKIIDRVYAYCSDLSGNAKLGDKGVMVNSNYIKDLLSNAINVIVHEIGHTGWLFHPDLDEGEKATKIKEGQFFRRNNSKNPNNLMYSNQWDKGGEPNTFDKKTVFNPKQFQILLNKIKTGKVNGNNTKKP
jgi:RHS repeat-associated protein